MKRVDKASIDQEEQRAVEKVNSTIMALANAISRYEANGRRPEFLAAKYARYREVQIILSDWVKKELKGRKGRYRGRIERLWELVRLCESIEV